MSRRRPDAHDRTSHVLGQRVLRALQVVTIGMYALLAAWMCSGLFLDTPAMLAWPWALAVLVAPAALVVYWRPARRVPDALFLTGVAACALGVGGAMWGSWLAPAIGGTTAVALCLAPGAGTRRARRA